MIQQIEFVSSHYGYMEEYVLDHTPAWIERKYIQAMKEKHEDHRVKILESFKGISLLVDAALNKGKNQDSLLPLPFDEYFNQVEEKKRDEKEYVEGEWWLSK